MYYITPVLYDAYIYESSPEYSSIAPLRHPDDAETTSRLLLYDSHTTTVLLLYYKYTTLVLVIDYAYTIPRRLQYYSWHGSSYHSCNHTIAVNILLI